MENRTFKDSTIKLFLKADPKRLIRLVNYVRKTDYPEDLMIHDNTLDNTLLMGVENDLSFTYDNDLNMVLIEHQSTINNNMAVRMLIYLGRIYERMSKSVNLYSSTRRRMPAPYFIVLYNGDEACPEMQTFNLKESFSEDNRDTEEISLQVHVFNINYDMERMPALLNENPDLREYAAFIDAVRRHKEKLPLEKAIERAIQEFKDNNVMGPFLEIHASEVLSMLTLEWNTEEYGKAMYEEGKEEGHAEGRAEGREEGIDIGILKNRCEMILNQMRIYGRTFEEAIVLLCISEEEAALVRADVEEAFAAEAAN